MQQTHPPKCSFLMSYYYYKDADFDAAFGDSAIPVELFADSGAFSAFTQGASIDIHDYIAWLQRWSHWWTAYANLDVIGNADATAVNQQVMEDAGLRPLPVFHTGTPFPVLDAMLDDYDYIALGGMVPYLGRKQILIPWLLKAFDMARGRGGYHGFGCGSWDLMRIFPWVSVDSSTPGVAYRYGKITLFDERLALFRSFQIGDRKNAVRLAALIRSYGYEPQEFWDRTLNSRTANAGAAYMAFWRAQQYIRAQRSPDTHTGEPFRFYFADGGGASGQNLEIIVRVMAAYCGLTEGHQNGSEPI